jgi:hypothetical protein
MATYNIKKEKGRVVVEVIVPALPPLAKDARKAKEVIKVENVRIYLESQGIIVTRASEACVVSNGGCGIFIFPLETATKTKEKPLKSGINVEKVLKDLTPASEPVIIEEQPKKRKRVKRVSKTGNKTTS